MKKCIIKASGSVIKDNYRSGCFLYNRHFRHGHLLKMMLNVAFVFVIRCCEANGDTLDDAIENANAAAYDWIYTEFIRPSHPGNGYLQRYCGQRLPPEAPDRSHRKPEEAFPQIP